MSKTKLTEKIEEALCREFNRQYGCLEVSIGIGSRIKERVDFMVYDHYKDVFKCFEIKVSKADFKSSAAKSFVGNYNYYVMPSNLYREVANEIPPEIGVYIARQGSYGVWLESVKKCRKKKLTDEEVITLKDSLIRSLSRDANRYYESNRAETVKILKKNLSKAYREIENLKRNTDESKWELSKLRRSLRYIYGEDWEEKISELVNKKKERT